MEFPLDLPLTRKFFHIKYQNILSSSQCENRMSWSEVSELSRAWFVVFAQFGFLFPCSLLPTLESNQLRGNMKNRGLILTPHNSQPQVRSICNYVMREALGEWTVRVWAEWLGEKNKKRLYYSIGWAWTGLRRKCRVTWSLISSVFRQQQLRPQPQHR